MTKRDSPLRRSFLGATVAALLTLLLPVSARGAELAAARDACPACIADVALYDPAYEEDGVWEDDVTALVAMFDAYGFTYRKVDAAALARGVLGSGKGRRFRALIEPGGWAYTRDASLGPSGVARVRAFLAGGGSYVGFCAGAYAAVATVRWDHYGTGWYQSYFYNLRLFDGSGWGPFAWMPWREGTNANLVEAAIDTSNPTMQASGMPARTRFLYGGGPWFEPLRTPPGWEVWARAVAPANAVDRTGDGKPAIVRYRYGKGTVILFAYHPEIVVGSTADHVVLSGPYDEDTVEWSTGELTLDQIAVDSWNVVHAALQVALGRTVTPVTELPGD